MMRKILFLDIDGVLNTGSHLSQDKYGDGFNPKAVANLAKIVDATGADIVISSSWKFMGLSALEQMWLDRVLPGKVIGTTPNIESDELLLTADLDHMERMPIRGTEIKEWLSHHKQISHYVIIDDMYGMLPEQTSHFVMTHPETGISEMDAEQAISILNKEVLCTGC
jgi:hypothetical protein